jgi:glycosyltransferase involved in cell wall biosynthesis
MRLVSELNLENDFIVSGFKSGPDLWEFLADSNILINTSLVEGVPNRFLESLILGNIIVTFNVGRVDSLIKDGLNGIIICDRDIDLMVESICQAISGNKEEIRVNLLRSDYVDIDRSTFDETVRHLAKELKIL